MRRGARQLWGASPAALGLATFGLLASGVGAPVRAADGVLSAEAYMLVDCLLPGQVRKLGRATTFLTPRRPVRTSATNCEIRGGEYVAADRATFESSLGVWLPTAQGGDAKAQAYVGRIYADGFGREPDYGQAAGWYQKAADQGYPQAMIDLGQLYERGLGVPKDAQKAVALYRRATGLPPAEFAGDAGMLQKVNAKYEAARADSESLSRELLAARAELAQERAALDKARGQLGRASSATPVPTPDMATQRQLAEVTAQLKAADARAAQLAADLANAKAAATKTAAPLTAQLKAAEAERAQMLAERQRMQAQLAAMRSQLPDQQGRVAFLEADAAQARKLADAANARLTDTLARLQAREADLGAAQARLADQQAHAAAHADDAAAAARLRATQADYDRQARELDQVRADAAARKAEIAAAQRAGQARDAELSRARAEAAAASAQLAKVQSDLDARDARLKASEARLSEAQGRTAQMQRDYDAAQARSASLAAEVANLKQESVRAKADGATSTPNLAAREAALAAREARVKALEAKVATGYRNVPATTVHAQAQPSRMWASSKFGFNQSYAILIGESNYRDPKLPKLDTPTNDVTQLGTVLQSRYGFNVTVMLDKSRAEILRQLDILSQKLNENDTLLIYYAGHGGMEKVRNGGDRGYWLPVDAEFGSSASQISNQEITYQVARMAARKVLIVADSCYSGLLSQTVSRAQRPAEADENSADYLIGMAHKQSRNVLTSGRLEPVLDGGGPGHHSVFAAALIDVLKANSDVITSEEIYNRLVTRVIAAATGVLLGDQDLPDPQQPTYSALDNGGHVFGDFVFVPRGPA